MLFNPCAFNELTVSQAVSTLTASSEVPVSILACVSKATVIFVSSMTGQMIGGVIMIFLPGLFHGLL